VLLVHRSNVFSPSKYSKVFHNEVVEVRGESCVLTPAAWFLSLAGLVPLEYMLVFLTAELSS